MGDEFVVVMPATSAEVARTVAERLYRRIAEDPYPVPRREDPLAVTVSIGVATACDAALEAEDILDRADGALYQAKRNGRNRVVAAGRIFDPPQAQAVGS